MQKENLRFFSSSQKTESFWRWTFLGIMVLFSAVLVIFWEPLRSQSFMTALSQWRPDWLYAFFDIFTTLGDDIGIMFITLFIFWCIDKKLGFSAMMVLLAAAIYMHLLKSFFYEPRPLEGQKIYDCLSFPSGHTLTTYVVWGYIAASVRNKILWVVAAVIVLLMGISRIVIGVHFPGDIIGGYIFGTIFLVAVLLLGHYCFGRKDDSKDGSFQKRLISLIVLFSVISLLVITIYPSSDATMVAGILAGLIIGKVLEEKLVRFHASGRWDKQVVKMVLGSVIMFLLARGISADFLDLPHWNIIRFFLTGLWATFIAPLLFVKLKLAQEEEVKADI